MIVLRLVIENMLTVEVSERHPSGGVETKRSINFLRSEEVGTSSPSSFVRTGLFYPTSLKRGVEGGFMGRDG